jgi:hypothetical protein
MKFLDSSLGISSASRILSKITSYSSFYVSGYTASKNIQNQYEMHEPGNLRKKAPHLTAEKCGTCNHSNLQIPIIPQLKNNINAIKKT